MPSYQPRIRQGILCSFHGPLAQPTTTRPRKVLVEPSTLYARKAALRRAPRGHARFGWIPAMIICNACIEPSGGRSRIFEVRAGFPPTNPSRHRSSIKNHPGKTMRKPNITSHTRRHRTLAVLISVPFPSFFFSFSFFRTGGILYGRAPVATLNDAVVNGSQDRLNGPIRFQLSSFAVRISGLAL